MPLHRSFLQILSVVVILTMLLSGVALPSASAQGTDGLERQVNAQTGKLSFIGPENGQALSFSRALGTSTRPQDPAMALAKRFGPEFGLKDPGRDLQEMQSDHTEEGRITARYQQNYQGIPVMGGELIVNTNENGDLYSINGEVSSDLSLSTQPTIDSEEAKQTALEAAAKWYGKTPEDFLASEPELWIYDESLLRPSTRLVELVWRMEVTPKEAGMPVRELVLVNAQRGNISLHFNQIDTAWSLNGGSGGSQDPDQTPTPMPTETPPPTETPQPEATPIPTEGTQPVEEASASSVSAFEVGPQAVTTWYVAPTGSDSNSCSVPALPCLTIDGAIAKAGTGETVRVASGTYTNTSGNVVTISKGLTLSGGWDNTFTTQNGASIIDGGGVRNGILANAPGSTIVVEYFVVQNSYTVFDSGGIYIYDTDFTLKNSAVINNIAGVKGGGIFMIANGSLTILNSTISGNRAGSSGGGIYAVNGTVTINNSTIASNNSNGTGGGFASENATVSTQNSILAKNTATGGSPDCSGSIQGSDHNIIGNTAGCTVTAGTGDFFNIDPLIDSALSGVIPFHTLLIGSPAIDGGDSNTCLTIDQRGMPRPQGSVCDIGAYEIVMSEGINIFNGSDQTTRISTTFALPFAVFVVDNLGHPVNGLTVTFSAPASGASGTFANTGTNVTTAVTDANGYATSSVFTANSQSGEYDVDAIAPGYDFPAVFVLSNTLPNLYVSPSGSDSNSCSSTSSPCATINGAIEKASDGDTIYVSTGLYQGSAAIVRVTKSVTIFGGWNSNFSAQTGYSILDGTGNPSNTLLVRTYKSTTIERLIIRNSAGGINVTNETTCPIPVSVTLRQTSITGITTWPAITGCGTVSLINSTVSNNQGGAIDNSTGTVIIQNSTITNNSYNHGTGGIRTTGGLVSIQNSILIGNTYYETPQDCSGTIISNGHNMIGTTRECSIALQASDRVGINPQLGSLLPNGYIPLLSNSPAIDSGASCPSIDQRGVSRPQGVACDIGAYEYATPGNATKLLIIDGNNQHTAPGVAFTRTFKIAVLDSQDILVPNVSVTFTAPGSGASGAFATTGTNTATVVSSSDGIATAPVFTANGQSGAYVVTASADGVGSVDFNLQNRAWYVASTGNDSNSCLSPSSPCATINGVINKASAGDAVAVAAGIYTGTGSEQVVLINKHLTLTGGWNNTFTVQNGTSIIDGQEVRGGISVNMGVSAVVDHFTIQNGRRNHGGGVANWGVLIISNTTIRHNMAGWTGSGSGGGGGILNTGTLTLNNSTVNNNIVIGGLQGGGIYNNGTILLNNSTVSDNTGGRSGIYNDAGVLVINNSTISKNRSYGIYSTGMTWGGAVTLKNTILAGNGSYGDCWGSIATQGYNLIGYKPADCTFTPIAGDLVGTSGSPINPRLTLLQDNGGSTFTHALTTGSPAIDAGNLAVPGSSDYACLATDQRGGIRPVGGRCDIGAYEGLLQWAPPYQVRTYTANHTGSLPGTFLCDQTDPSCAVGDIRASAAHEYAIGTYNFYANQFLRNSLDNKGMTIVSTINYSLDYDYDNAYWNGSQIVYGDYIYDFLMADDVVAHELTHGVTQFESNLFYYYQSGAIDESFSDLWGEYYDQSNGSGNDRSDVKWLIGEDVSIDGVVRNMSNPPAYGDPDSISSSLYCVDEYDNGCVHDNSGVNNKAVYLMVDGGTFNGKTITALGWSKTATIYYEVNTNLLSSGADYSDLYYAVQQACSNLIGQKGITAGDCAEVKGALDAVEMNLQPRSNPIADAPYCDAGASLTTIFADNFESGTENWTFNNGSNLRWQLDSPYGPYAKSGAHSLYADDYPPAVTDATARLKPLFIPSNAYLHFAHAYDFETYLGTHYDGSVLEYSIDNGTTWQDAGPLMDYNGYTGRIFSGFSNPSNNNPLKDRLAFVGVSYGYISTRVNLYPLTGQTVSFRWRMGLDKIGYDWGWWVDNVQVYTCPVILSTDTTGVFRPSNGALYLKNSNTTGFADVQINYGLGGDYPVVGDWDGDGDATIGIYRNGSFYLRNENTIGFADIVFPFGAPGDQPVAGDWNNDGVDTIGVYRNGAFFLRNSNDAGAPEMIFALGVPGDVGIAGDWDGDGDDTTGVFRPSNGALYLKNTNVTGFADIQINYGLPGDQPVTGDWDSNGTDTIGIYRNGAFYLRNSNTIGFADLVFGLGVPGDHPIAGNWDGLP